MIKQSWVLNFVIIVGTVVSALLALTIIISAAVYSLFLPEGETPKFLNDWGGLVIGFYFGSFISLIKDLFNLHTSDNTDKTKPITDDKVDAI